MLEQDKLFHIKIGTLIEILKKEIVSGFSDATVVGGVDKFLLKNALQLKPVLGNIKSYSRLDQSNRKKWIDLILKNLTSYDSLDFAYRSNKFRMEFLNQKIDQIPKINFPGKTKIHSIKLFSELGIKTIFDLITYFPYRYNDFSDICKISELKYGEFQTVFVEVMDVFAVGKNIKRPIIKTVLFDSTGSIEVIWFNQPYIRNVMKVGLKFFISGKLSDSRGKLVFENPEYESFKNPEELMHTGRLVPVYSSTDGVNQKSLRRIIANAVNEFYIYLPDPIKKCFLDRLDLITLNDSIQKIHYPNSELDILKSKRRLAFSELFNIQLAVLQRKKDLAQASPKIKLESNFILDFEKILPFSLTNSQKSVIKEIFNDLKSGISMSRLLQGDVGSGKTVVALAAMLGVIRNGFQSALMAPTELLAEQHFQTIMKIFSENKILRDENFYKEIEVKFLKHSLKVGLLIGGISQENKTSIQKLLSDGEIDLVVGTHSLIQEKVEIPKLALAIVDEQHRFGVMQRQLLVGNESRPHLLMMSATPIPRSLAFTVYGDLDISVINEMPIGRQPIKTILIEYDDINRGYELLESEIKKGRQGFIVCPLIEDSEKLSTSSAMEVFHRLSNSIFSKYQMELIHGRLNYKEKDKIMNKFSSGEIDILVSTTVIEVGIDVPNASVMLIEGAERFGLAQLHQLRGRVGRGRFQSLCLLISMSSGGDALDRMKVLESVDDGFELAEHDLRIRGPGDFVGTRQSGLADLKIANLMDYELINLTRNEALNLLSVDPSLSKSSHRLLRDEVKFILDRLKV